MELKKLKEDDKTMLVEVVGESFTLTNAIREYLWDDKSVSEAAQIKEHPYLSQPKIFVKTDRGSPVTALEKATEKIVEDTKEFKQKFKEALKK
ncbi:MAG: DNA-directed RNA polymerase subunit L [Candidatus Aenigmarchaeota archaeon]|nr:DNA-directed RNA polymerase subunit L [Candidatus Aenigmarchaeota archaeon]